MFYTQEQIYQDFLNLSPEEKVAKLFSALTHMESNNSRSQIWCICLAMGYRNEQGYSHSWFKSEKCELQRNTSAIIG